MTRKDNYQQNAERSMRHNTWEREPILPAWSLWVAALFFAAFIIPIIMGVAS